jgi:integrase
LRSQSATTTITHAVTFAGGVFAPGHLGELTRYLPFELVDDVLEQTRTVRRRLRVLPSRAGVYFVLALAELARERARLPDLDWHPNGARQPAAQLGPHPTTAGLTDTRFHDMRHTCVSLLLHLGVAPDMVREIVGHSDIEVTMTIYAHTSLTEKRQAFGKLGDALT